MEGFRAIFQGVEDPRKSNATKHPDRDAGDRPSGDAVGQLVVRRIRALCGVQIRISEGIHGAQGRSAEPRRLLRPVQRP